MSAYWTILDSVRTVLGALPGLAGVQIKIRKRPFFSTDHGDVYPMVCLATNKEDVADLYTPNGAWLDYPVFVVLFQKEGATLQKESELKWQLDRRDEVRTALWKKEAAGLSDVFDVKYDPGSAFDLAGLEKLHDVSVQWFMYRHNGPRSS